MGDRSIPQRPRFAVLVVVAALHLFLVTVLIAASRIQLRSPAAQGVITTMVSLPRAIAPLAPGPAPSLHLAPLARLPPVLPEAPSIAYPPADDVPHAIDWQAEAQKAAAAITGSKGVPSVPSETEDRRKTSSSHGPRPWFPPRAHHAGEEYKSLTGDSIIWVSDKCYVRSAAPMLGLAQILARSRGSTTVCPGSSGNTRGDLFEALPAYKKYHRDTDPGK